MLTQEDIKNLKESLKDTFVTKEYFDVKLSYLIENIGNKFESLEGRFDSKLAAQTDILIDYTHQAFEAQQEYLDERFEELIVVYDVRDRVAKLEKRI